MGFLKDWRATRKMKTGRQLSQEELNQLYRVVKKSTRIKGVLRAVWAVIAGVCSIVAAVFSVLAYLKQ